MPDGFAGEMIVGIPGALGPVTPYITAGELISSIRYQIPDPSINPLTGEQDDPYNPDHEGAVLPRALLYRWLWDGTRDLTRRCHWLIEDWWAFQSLSGQPAYKLDTRWHQIEAAFAYQFRCYPLPEQWTIYPSQAIAQPFQYGYHGRAGALEPFFYPTPNRQDPTTALPSTIGVDPMQLQIPVASVANFLSFGYVLIDGELISYQSIVTNPDGSGTLFTCRRGCGGTRVMPHDANAPVYHCGLWIKGWRTPTQIQVSSDPLEIPPAFIEPLELFCLAKVFWGPLRDPDMGKAMDLKYKEAVESIIRDPVWQGIGDPVQVAAYGYGGGGRLTLYGTDPFGTILP
jgi:hypothetical protein